MTRSDEILYTAMSNAAERRSARQRQHEDNLRKKAELIKDAKVVFEEIERHKAELGEKVLRLVDSSMNDAQVRTFREAVLMHREWVNSLESKLRIVLRAKPPKPQRETDDE